MIDVTEAFGKANVGNESQTEAMATLYLAGLRAEQVGWEKLNFENTAAVKADYARLQAVLKADPKAKTAFEEGAKLYQQYNAGLLDLLTQTGFLSKTKAAELKAIQYVPYYRVAANGDVQLMVDKETPIRLSNIKDEPQLIELVGDNKHIQPLFTSSIQNTFMITNMALRNQMVKDSAVRMGILPASGKPGDSQTKSFNEFQGAIDQRISSFESSTLQGKRKASQEELKKILQEVEMDKVYKSRSIIWDKADVPIATMKADELQNAYVMVGEEKVPIASIPAAQRVQIIPALKSAGYPITEKNIASFWVRGGKKQ
jgi:hypothetical protein